MNVVVFGAAGRTGRHVIGQGLESGLHITAFDLPWKEMEAHHPNLQILRGDALKAQDVDAAVKGHTAVISVLGEPMDSSGHELAPALENIIASMQRHGVGRLVSVSALGVGETRQHVGFLFNLLLTPAFVEAFVEDKRTQEDIIVGSGLEWTIVRPGRLTDGPLTKHYHHGFGSELPSTDPAISRADLAHFVLTELKDRTYLRQFPGICY